MSDLIEKNQTETKEFLLSEKTRLRLMGLSSVISIFLSVKGYVIYQPEGGLLNAFYHSLQLFLLHAPHNETPLPWQLEVGRWLAALSTGLVILNLTLYYFYHELMEFKLRNIKNHTIICGMGRKGLNVVENLSKINKKIIVIEKQPTAGLREFLAKMGIPLIIGDASKNNILIEARIKYAKTLYALCQDDSVNCAIAMKAYKIKCNSDIEIQLFVHVNDSELRAKLQINNINCSSGSRNVIRFIDVFEPEAISLLMHDLPIDHDGIKADDLNIVHLVILGFGRMGQSIAVKAAQLGVFANNKKLKISVIDRNASKNRNELLFHHHYIEEVADFKFYEMEIFSLEAKNKIEEWCKDISVIVNIVVCFDDQILAYHTLFNYLTLLKNNNIRTAIRVQEPENMELLLQGINKINFKIKAFGLTNSYEKLTNPENNEINRFAKSIHQAYIDLTKEQFKNKPTELKEILETDEMQNWDELKEDFKESNIQQALHIYIKLRSLGYEIADKNDKRQKIIEFNSSQLNNLAIMEHNRWVAERKVNNWIFGEKSDKSKKINKNIVDWEKLDVLTKEYDYDAVKRIPLLLELIDKKMVKKAI